MNNELLKQIAVEAGFIASAPTLSPTLEKFAELLIRECEVILSKESERLYGLSSHGSDDYDICADKCRENIKAIKEHFGVEE